GLCSWLSAMRNDMQTTIYIVLAFSMGLIMSIYLPMNSSVAKYTGSSITANVIFFIVALLTSALIFLLSGQFNAIRHLKDVPAFLYSAGFVSAFVVLGTTFLIPHIGARKFFILLIAGQILMAIIVSHFGLLESPKDPVNMKKVIGAILVLTGAIFSTY
ncbi:MAG: DMT family transporter, partial [Desulfobacterales bacterium]